MNRMANQKRRRPKNELKISTGGKFVQSNLNLWIKTKEEKNFELNDLITLDDDSQHSSSLIQLCSPSPSPSTSRILKHPKREGDGRCSMASVMSEPDAKRRRPGRFTPQISSNVENFPTIVISHKNFLLTVSSFTTNSNDEVVELICENRESVQETIKIHLSDIWSGTNVSVGSVLRVIDPLWVGENEYEVSSLNGLLVLEPEILISPTSLQQSLYCPRKAVFQDRFRGFPSEASLPLLLGSAVHELFQMALVNPERMTPDLIIESFHNYLLPTIAEDINELELTTQDFISEMIPYVRNFTEWIEKYAKSHNRPPLQGHNECFEKAIDIEENFWSSTIGIKGKIDVSMVLKPVIENDENKPNGVPRLEHEAADTIYPLELKTGKSHENSIEHQAQVLLYSLLLSERWNKGKIVPGFLLYLKDNRMRKIVPKAADLRGLLHLRNRIIYSFAKFTLNSFPETLTEPRKCNGCPYATMCGLVYAAEKQMPDAKNSNSATSKTCNSPEMEDFLESKISHLTIAEKDYATKKMLEIFTQWSNHPSSSFTKRLFSEKPQKRHLNGICKANMVIKSEEESNSTETKFTANKMAYLITFAPSSKHVRISNKNSIFCKGQSVIISSEKFAGLMFGSVYSIKDDSITIRTEKSLKNSVLGNVFHIDKYESSSMYTSKLAELAELMEDNSESAKLRATLINEHKNV